MRPMKLPMEKTVTSSCCDDACSVSAQSSPPPAADPAYMYIQAVHTPCQRSGGTKEESDGQSGYRHSLACVRLGDAVAVRVPQTIRRGARLPKVQRLRNLREVGID